MFPSKILFLGYEFCQFTSKTLVSFFVETLLASYSKNIPKHIVTLNPEMILLAEKNKSFKDVLRSSTIKICDGVGISFISQIFEPQKICRIPGVTVGYSLCLAAQKTQKSVFFLGGKNIKKGLLVFLSKNFPNLRIAGVAEDASVQAIKKTSPDVLLVCFGAPKQELWIAKNAEKLPSLKLVGGFGGTFDFWSGKIMRAPKFLQIIGLEWAWRLLQEPQKRFPRIVNALIRFPVFYWKNRKQT